MFSAIEKERRLQCIRREAFIQVALWSGSVPRSSEGWTSLMQFTALGAAPPADTQLLSPACLVLPLCTHQTQHIQSMQEGSLQIFVVVCTVL